MLAIICQLPQPGLLLLTKFCKDAAMTQPTEQPGKALGALKDIIAQSVKEAMESVAKELHVRNEIRFSRSTEQRSTCAQHQVRIYMLVGTQRVQPGGMLLLGTLQQPNGLLGGMTPSGTGSLPHGFNLPGLQSFQPLGGIPPSLGELPFASLIQPSTSQSAVGEIIAGHLLPPVPMKIAQKIWRWEFMDLTTLLSHRLWTPEPTLADALQSKNIELK